MLDLRTSFALLGTGHGIDLGPLRGLGPQFSDDSSAEDAFIGYLSRLCIVDGVYSPVAPVTIAVGI